MPEKCPLVFSFPRSSLLALSFFVSADLARGHQQSDDRHCLVALVHPAAAISVAAVVVAVFSLVVVIRVIRSGVCRRVCVAVTAFFSAEVFVLPRFFPALKDRLTVMPFVDVFRLPQFLVP